MKFVILMALVVSSAFATDYSCTGNNVSVDITDNGDGTAQIVVVKDGKRSVAKNANKEETFDIEFEGTATGNAKSIKVTIVDGDTDKLEILGDYVDPETDIDCSEK